MTDTASSQIAAPPLVSPREERVGFLLVFLSALMWSFGGTIARFIDTTDSWTVVFWGLLHGFGLVVQESVRRLYRPPVFNVIRVLDGGPVRVLPPQTIISLPVHTAV